MIPTSPGLRPSAPSKTQASCPFSRFQPATLRLPLSLFGLTRPTLSAPASMAETQRQTARWTASDWSRTCISTYTRPGRMVLDGMLLNPQLWKGPVELCFFHTSTFVENSTHGSACLPCLARLTNMFLYHSIHTSQPQRWLHWPDDQDKEDDTNQRVSGNRFRYEPWAEWSTGNHSQGA